MATRRTQSKVGRSTCPPAVRISSFFLFHSCQYLLEARWPLGFHSTRCCQTWESCCNQPLRTSSSLCLLYSCQVIFRCPVSMLCLQNCVFRPKVCLFVDVHIINIYINSCCWEINETMQNILLRKFLFPPRRATGSVSLPTALPVGWFTASVKFRDHET